MKRIVLCGLLLFLALAACLPAIADKIQPIILDEAGLLSSEETDALRLQMEPLCECGTPMLWITYSNGTAETICRRKFAEVIGSEQSGVLFMINFTTHELYLYVDGAIGETISVSDCLDITDNVYRRASGGYYRSCAEEAFSQVGRLMRSENISRVMRIVTSALLALSTALMLTFVIVTLPGHQLNIFKIRKRPLVEVHPSAVPAQIAGEIELTVTSNKLIRSVRRADVSSSGGGSGHIHVGSGGGFHSSGGHSGGHSGGGHGGGHRF